MSKKMTVAGKVDKLVKDVNKLQFEVKDLVGTYDDIIEDYVKLSNKLTNMVAWHEEKRWEFDRKTRLAVIALSVVQSLSLVSIAVTFLMWIAGLL